MTAFVLALVLQALEERLLKEGAAALAEAARREGDARRGAAVFHNPQIGCARCHAEGLGPDLSRLGPETTDALLAESVLEPSRAIRAGFETITVETDEGEFTGLRVEEKDGRLLLREPAPGGRRTSIELARIRSRRVSALSTMPSGLAGGLAGRREFLDLVRYLAEIRDGGPTRAAELAPPPTTLPDYEARLDHAGLIREARARRGEALYARVCANCHGTHEAAGSLPTSPRFATAVLKNGSDPYSMYQTLTRGFGMMTPQTWMAPRQKYDVIAYVREAYFKAPAIEEAYLASLPKGGERGPAPKEFEPWVEMDYGPALINTYEAGGNFAHKGIAVRLDPGPGGVGRGRLFMLFDHDTMRAVAGWSGGFIDWNGIHFNGRHGVHPRIGGTAAFSVAAGPGWADPATGSFDDPRLRGRDGRAYGPLPRSWTRYRGLYLHDQQVVVAYTVGACDVLEMAGATGSTFTRTIRLGPRDRELTLRTAERDVTIPAGGEPHQFTLSIGPGEAPPAPDLTTLTKGGPARWPQAVETKARIGADDGPFAVDVLTPPSNNPWQAQVRLTGLDFFPDGARAAVCAWDGDVWIVSGIDRPEGGLSWRRVATGLFQPLGVKIVDGAIHVTCRDQIAILRDLNGDGETDFIECFNSDHQVTEHFHEFAMGLQTDAEGNFYYAKSARHALPALVPHHGTLLKVSRDGSKTEILATGFRAANGVCLNPDGSFFVTDQEGHWTPKNRINRVVPGRFYGNMFGHHDVTDASDTAMEPPVCWITNEFDRSPAELVRVQSAGWRELDGALLNLSYGTGKVFVVLTEEVGGLWQGGMTALPIPNFPTGVMRGRFHPKNGHLYVCGMHAWAGDATAPGGFYRIRRTDRPLPLPVGLHARRGGVEIVFGAPVDRAAAADPAAYRVRTWSLRRTADYGSKHHDEQKLKVRGATLSDDGRSVVLELPDLAPTQGMEIRYSIGAAQGAIHNTIHRLADAR